MFYDEDYDTVYDREDSHRGFIAKCLLILIVLIITYALSRIKENDKKVKQSLASKQINTHMIADL